MPYGVNISMSHESSLTTVALLSAYTENKNNHYLDLLIPFVEYCIPSMTDAIFDCREISQKLGAEFGIIDMPENIVETILKRYGKNRPGAIEKKDRSRYVVRKKPDHADFEQRRRSIQNEITTVSNKFEEFMATQPWRKPGKNAKLLLLDFFQSYGLTVVRNVEELYMVSQTNDSELFVVAKFVLWAYEQKSSLFNTLTDLTKGFLTYRAIYQIDEGDKQDHMSKLHDVKCFLDCSLLISLLGYDTQESRASAQGLIQILQKNGGKICVFNHTIDEATSLLMAYANSPDKLGFRLPGIKAKRLSDAIVRVQASTLDTTIGKYGITRQAVTDDDLVVARDDLASLSNCIREIQGNDCRSEYDFRSIVGVKKLRNGMHPTRIENCTAILVTQDLRLISALRKFESGKQHEVAFAKLDTDIMALMWLQTFTACPEVPKEILLSNAAAAVTLSDDVRKRAIELTDMWLADGSMDPSMVRIFRSDRLDEMLFADCTGNDPDALNADTVKKAVMQGLAPEIEAEREKVRLQERVEYDRRIEEVSQEKDAMAWEIQRQQQEAARQRDVERARRIENKAQKIAECVRNFVQWGIFFIGGLYVTVTSLYQCIDMYKEYQTATQVSWLEWFLRISVILFAGYGTVSTFFSGKITARRILNAVERKVYSMASEYYERVADEWNRYD